MEELKTAVSTLTEIVTQFNPAVLFVIAVSYGINKYCLWLKAKFITPLVLSLLCAFVMADRIAVKQIMLLWFSYAGQSTLFYELFKNYFPWGKKK